MTPNLEEYAIRDEELTMAEQKVKEALKAKSDIIAKLVKQHGKGPFEYKGAKMIAVVKNGHWFLRRSKNKTSKTSTEQIED